MVLDFNTPVYVLEQSSGEVYRYRSFADFTKTTEEIDIEENEYKVWDLDGFPVVLRSDPDLGLVGERVSTQADPELREALLRFAARIGATVAETMTYSNEHLNDLITQKLEAGKLSSRLKAVYHRFRGRNVIA